jgi:cation diffusion facilitator CzcD-associated flavoprotein CzcO
MKRTVKKWNLDRDLELNTKVVEARWQDDIAQWKVIVERDGVQRDEYCHVLISSQGVLVYVFSTMTIPETGLITL